MEKKGIINLSSLKDQVYEYLRHQMKIGELRPGAAIDMNATSEKLGVSKTPLRDALIQLEKEGFVEIMPRRGVGVSVLTIQDIKEIDQIVGALESMAIIAAADRLQGAEVKKMEKLNQKMGTSLERDDFDAYYEENLKFHDIFLSLSGNEMLRKTADILKKRLYDFPRRVGYIKEWEEASLREHQQILKFISEGEFLEAANYMRDVHWSFAVQERFINMYYADSPVE